VTKPSDGYIQLSLLGRPVNEVHMKMHIWPKPKQENKKIMHRLRQKSEVRTHNEISNTKDLGLHDQLNRGDSDERAVNFAAAMNLHVSTAALHLAENPGRTKYQRCQNRRKSIVLPATYLARVHAIGIFQLLRGIRSR
jgi:hypothetical protein